MQSFFDMSETAVSEHAQNKPRTKVRSFFDKAKKAIDENPEMFAALEELDRTGKFKKRTYKKKVDFTIDEDVFNMFRAYCKKNNINMSAKVESLIKEVLKNVRAN